MRIAATLKLLARLVTGKAPIKAVYYAAMIRLSRSFTGRRRFEFEKLYAEDGDPWGYFSRAYEQEKYRRTLDFALEHCAAKTSALEVGCSVGVFTKMMAQSFDSILAIDISNEAVMLAAKTLVDAGNVEVRRDDFLALQADGRTFDVIFFAEVLYYLEQTQAPDVCAALLRLLSARGVFVVVHPTESEGGPLPWDGIFGQAFDRRAAVTIADAERPYEISVYARRSEQRDVATPGDVGVAA
jgi:SAM-dependent methyltransferase